MRAGAVVQFAPQVRHYDAVGNEVFALHHLLTSSGIESYISGQLADAPAATEVRPWSRAARLTCDAVLIHYSHSSPHYQRVFACDLPKVMVYHSITPAEFFRGTSMDLEQASQQGLEELARYSGQVVFALAHSTFSAQELEHAGFRNVVVFPYVLDERLYAVDPDKALVGRYGGDGWVNLLTVGRVAPNKCLEDCILIFDYFRRVVESKSRLFVVGRWQGTEAYLARLRKLVALLGVEGVYFTGPVTQSTLMGYLKVAHAFLCMSEHEGFGVPLVEAMRHGVPVFAYASSAVPETLRGTGVLFQEKRWPVIAEAVGLLLADEEHRRNVIAEQGRQAEFYSEEAAAGRLRACLGKLNLR